MQNSEIEKIANLMVHDGISPDEQDAVQTRKIQKSNQRRL